MLQRWLMQVLRANLPLCQLLHRPLTALAHLHVRSTLIIFIKKYKQKNKNTAHLLKTRFELPTSFDWKPGSPPTAPLGEQLLFTSVNMQN